MARAAGAALIVLVALVALAPALLPSSAGSALPSYTRGPPLPGKFLLTRSVNTTGCGAAARVRADHHPLTRELIDVYAEADASACAANGTAKATAAASVLFETDPLVTVPPGPHTVSFTFYLRLKYLVDDSLTLSHSLASLNYSAKIWLSNSQNGSIGPTPNSTWGRSVTASWVNAGTYQYGKGTVIANTTVNLTGDFTGKADYRLYFELEVVLHAESVPERGGLIGHERAWFDMATPDRFLHWPYTYGFEPISMTVT